MHVRRLLPLLLAALVVPTAAVAADGTVLEAPVGLEQADLDGQTGQLQLLEGTQSLVLANPTGTLEVWTYRVPCLQQNEDSCLEANAATDRRTIDLDGGSLTLSARQGMSYEVHIDLEDGTFQLSDDEATLAVRSEAHNRTLYATDGSSPQPPRAFNTISHARGAVAHATQAPSLEAQGSYTLRVANATVDVVDPEAENRELVTGWSWQQSDSQGFSWERQLQLVRVVNTGSIEADWDGIARVTPSLPLTVHADRAHARILEGSLLGAEAGDASHTLQAAIFQVTAFQPAREAGGSQDGEQARPAALVVQEGPAAPNAPTPDDQALSDTALYGGGAAVLVGLAAVAYYWPRISWAATALVLPMYSRIEKSDLLDNEIREELYETVQEDPGIHAHALSEALDIGWGTTVYHLRRLERNGMVTSEKRGRYRRFFPAAGYVARTREVLSVLQNDTTNDIARYILRHPGTNQKGICEALDISPSLANWHINRLMDAELVERERRGRTVHYTPGTAWEEVGDAVDMAA